jgi:ATP-dependent exoDNAse (exonuclease V) beta subunit
VSASIPKYDPLQGLNKKQRLAACAQGAAVVSAGAGTGKTKTLVARYLRLLEASGNAEAIDSILAITYTTTGAGEMRRRIERQLRQTGQVAAARHMSQAWISTIHGFCSRILRQYALRLDLDPEFSVIPDTSSLLNQAWRELCARLLAGAGLRSFATQAAFQSLLANNRYSEYSLKKGLEALLVFTRRHGFETGEPGDASFGIYPDTGHNVLFMGEDIPVTQIVLDLCAESADIYESLKREEACLDYDDLLFLMRRLTADKQVVRDLCRRFRFIMIDEFQDTNAMQLSFLERIAQNNLYLVGDEKQSIYRFQGAELKLFTERLDGAEANGELCTLDENYRSHAEILEFINKIFSQAQLFERPYRPLRAGRNDDTGAQQEQTQTQRVSVAAFSAEGKAQVADFSRAEAQWVAQHFAELAQQGADFNDMAILVSRRKEFSFFVDACAAHKLPVQIIGGTGFYTLPIIKEARAFVDVLRNPKEGSSFLRLLLGPFGRVSDTGLVELARIQKEKGDATLWDSACTRIDADSMSNARDRAAVEALCQTISRARDRLGSLSLSELLARAFSERELDLYYLRQGISGQQAWANFRKLLRIADNFQESGADPLGFGSYLDECCAGAIDDEVEVVSSARSFVRLMTIHNAKGSEFPIVALALSRSDGAYASASAPVFLPGFTAQGQAILTTRLGPGKSSAYSTHYEEFLQKERALETAERVRLLYVALTRAQERVLISYRPSAKGGMSAVLSGALATADFDTATIEQRAVVRAESVDMLQLFSDETVSDLHYEGSPRVVPPTGEQPLSVHQVSASDIAAFHECPRQFHYYQSLRLGQLLDQSPSTALNRGSLLHQLLEYTDLKAQAPDPQLCEVLFARHALDTATAAASVNAACRFLGSFRAAELAACTALEKERQFYVRLVPESSSRTVISRSISGANRPGPRAQTPRYLKGYIDVLAWRADGSALIVDYKSGGRLDDEKTADDYRDQADCYALVALSLAAPRVEVVFVRPEVIDPDSCDPQEFSFTYGREDQGRLTEKIRAVIVDMQQAATARLSAVKPRTCELFCQIPPQLCERKKQLISGDIIKEATTAAHQGANTEEQD